MRVHPVVASVVGGITDERWGQVLQTPHAYGVVEVFSYAGIARQRGIHTLTQLTRIFDMPPVSLAELEKVAETVAKDADIVSLILLVPVGKTLYIVSRGRGRVYLKRDNQFALLVNGTRSLSGDAQNGDVVIAASDGFARALTSEEITGVFDHLAPVEVAEKLTMRLHEKDGGEGGAALIFHITIEDDAESDGEEAAEPVPAKIPPAVRFRRVRAAGRRLTFSRQRTVVHTALSRMRGNPAFTPKRLVMYVLLFLFTVSVVFGIMHGQTTAVRGELTETISQAKHSYDEGLALLELNSVKGRQRLTTARDLLEPVVSRNLDTAEGREASRLYADVTESLIRAMRAYEVVPELYFDVSLLKDGAAATDISLFEHTIGILDANGRTVFTLGAQAKSGKIVGGGAALTGAAHAALYADKMYVWTPDGVHLVRLSDNQTILRVIPKSPEWGKIADITVFGGNVYLLDIEKHRIWKYVATEDGLPAGRQGFSDLFDYLNPDFFPDLSHARNLVIDGSVWLGTDNGSVVRFTSGQLNTFVTQGEDRPPGSSVRVYTSDSAQFVYVLDKDASRVVVYDKEGFYIAQYAWQDGTPATDLVVSEELGRLFLLAGGKLYTITLQ